MFLLVPLKRHTHTHAHMGSRKKHQKATTGGLKKNETHTHTEPSLSRGDMAPEDPVPSRGIDLGTFPQVLCSWEEGWESDLGCFCPLKRPSDKGHL